MMNNPLINFCPAHYIEPGKQLRMSVDCLCLTTASQEHGIFGGGGLSWHRLPWHLQLVCICNGAMAASGHTSHSSADLSMQRQNLKTKL